MAPRKFWRKRNLISEMLVPFSVLWFFWMRIRELRAHPKKLPAPVICIGNITVGGAGKTPVAIAVAKLLTARGHKPAFLSRGYGGKLKGPLKVDPATHTAAEVGDEPLLLARVAPCYVAKNRLQAADIALMGGATVLIADDGMQNHGFHKDLTLAVVDAGYGFGNGLVLPAGPLRDRADLALKAAHAVVLIGSHAEPKTLEIIHSSKLPLHLASLHPDTLPDTQTPYVAFAGIGIPAKFFTTLKQVGVNVAVHIPFPDHHPYSGKDLAHLEKLAKEKNAKLITTEKDAVRLPPEFRTKVATLAVTFLPDEPESFRTLVERPLA